MKTSNELFNFIQATLNLFKAVPKFENENLPKYVLANEKNLENGFLVTVKTFQNCPYVASTKILDFIREKFGYDIYELNQSFYKSFNKVASFTPKEVFFDKITRYLSTYGMESLGQFERDFVYIPNEALNFPPTADPLRVFIVGSMSESEIRTRTLKLINTGAALSGDLINSVIDVINYLDIEIDIENVPNKEFLVKLCEKLQIAPRNPVQFLRQMIYIGTGSTLLIKNSETIENLKKSNTKFDGYFISYIKENGIDKLASIFHRFKPLWLAFKPHSNYLRATINRIRKLADHYHKPVEPKLLEKLTSAENFSYGRLKIELSKVTVYKKVALANALLYRFAAPENIAYNIRNGKIFVKDYKGEMKKVSKDILDMVVESIVEDIRPNVQGKKIYIPENFNYAVPVSEKKFVGNIPYGSSYSFKNKACVVGVYWLNLMKNNDEIRVDLDLHLNGGEVDADWNDGLNAENIVNTNTHRIIYSGDMTDAPLDRGGATEAFFIGEFLMNKVLILNVNHYNRELFRLYKRSKNLYVPFNLILAEVPQAKIDKQFLLEVHETAFNIPCKIETGGMFLGFIVADENGDKKFYFCSRNIGNGIATHNTERTNKINSAMTTAFENYLSLNEVLEKAGAILKNVDPYNCDINLDPVSVMKENLINLLAK